MSDQDLPPYLHNQDPMEWEDIPLQVALLTMELASMRQTLAALIDRQVAILDRHQRKDDEEKQARVDAMTGVGDEWIVMINDAS